MFRFFMNFIFKLAYLYDALDGKLKSGLTLRIVQKFIPFASTSTHRWGTLTSLYTPLSNQDSFLLQCAIRFRILGQYDAASFIFNALLPGAESALIIAIERAKLFDAMGRLDEALDELGAALKIFAANPAFEDTAEHYLLRIFTAEVQMYAHGTFKASLAEARTVEKWMKHISVDNYTDVMVSIKITRSL